MTSQTSSPNQSSVLEQSSKLTLEILVTARKKIENPNDWGKGARRNRDNFESCCAAEAIEEAFPFSDEVCIARMAACRLLRKAAGMPNDQMLVDWNDADSRTHAEVLAAFDLAITRATGGA